MAGRRTRQIELLDTLVKWAGGPARFLVLTGIRPGEQNHYLAGRKSISLKRLKTVAHEVFGTPPAFCVLAERNRLPTSLPKLLSGRPGVYALFSSVGSLIYFGKATDLRTEINQTLGREAPRTLVMGIHKKKYSFRSLTSYYSAYEVVRGDSSFRHDVESLVLRVSRRDTLNAAGGHFNRDD